MVWIPFISSIMKWKFWIASHTNFPEYTHNKKLFQYKVTWYIDKDRSSDPGKNNNYMFDSQVYGLTSEIEAIKMFIKD